MFRSANCSVALEHVSRVIWLLLVSLCLAVPVRAEVLGDVGSPQLLIQSAESHTPALLTATKLEMDIAGDGAEATLKQIFVNPSDEWVDALYVLPVPDKAAVHGLTIELDGRRIIGKIRERREAQQVYQQAAAQGQRASLLEQLSPDLFNMRIANIAPQGSVVVEVSLSLAVQRDNDWYTVQFPTTLTPRYDLLPDGFNAAATALMTSTASHLGLQPAPVFEHRLDYRLTLRAHGSLGQVVTPLHQSQKRWQGNVLEISSGRAGAPMDRDLVLRWQLREPEVPAPNVLLESHEGDYYAELALLPPTPALTPAPQARDLVLVIDVSGSMDGMPIRQAVAAAQTALADLRPQDRFDIVTFESRTRALFGELVSATPDTIHEAQRFLQRLDAEGGTEMYPALAQAFAYAASEADPLRQVMFLTDGAVAGEAALFRLIHEQLGQSRLFTVAIGSAPNIRFMRRAAAMGRGVYRQIASLDEVERELTALLKLMSHPVVTQVQIDWPVGAEPAVPIAADLYLGQPLIQRVKLDEAPAGGRVEVSGLLDGRPWRSSVQLPALAQDVASGTTISRRWASQRIDWLLDGAWVAGIPQSHVRPLVLALGLKHQLATPFTSFVAVEQRVSRPQSESARSRQVPAMPPAGAAHFASTALGIDLWIYAGVACLLLGVVMLRLCREEAVHAPSQRA